MWSERAVAIPVRYIEGFNAGGQPRLCKPIKSDGNKWNGKGMGGQSILI